MTRNYRQRLKSIWRAFGSEFWKVFSFLSLLLIFLLIKAGVYLNLFLMSKHGTLARKLLLNKPAGSISSKISRFLNRLSGLLENQEKNSISRTELIELAMRNMKAKKTRTLITVGGMMIGIGAIVFLVSIGYGIEKLVVTRVARLDEMRQTDVSPQAGGKIKINDKTLSDLKDISSVEMALPLIAVVGRVSYMNSETDMPVYGVTSDYLKQSAIKPVSGKIFESDDLSYNVSNLVGQVAGASIDQKIGAMEEKITDVDYSIDPDKWIRVRSGASISSKIIGYTKRTEGGSSGIEVWGSQYESDSGVGSDGETEDGEVLGKWIKTPVLLWKRENCDPAADGDCEDGRYVVYRNADNQQVQETGYIAEIGIKLSELNIKEPSVLGDTTDSTLNINWVEIASEAGVITPPEVKKVDLSASAIKQAVVNRAMLSVLGIKESDALDKKFNASFVVVGDLLSDPTANIESSPSEYTIIGVTPEEKTPVFYVPFLDLRSLGIANFSQAKVIVKDQIDLAKTRKQIESMGYATRSVADTVAQINSLFATARTMLLLLGMVALSVAALGMFNTLTVSLLERTREVGLMKAMGMKSSEVKELFLTESMLMGFFGGLLGIMLGWVMGKIIGILLSLFAIFKGVGFVDISYIPFPFILVIIFLSLIVGLVTGIYPARRTTKISALNALRYE